jgi:CxxC-x17-CxxC domain-containing protein
MSFERRSGERKSQGKGLKGDSGESQSERVMHDGVCERCLIAIQVPFEPIPGRPLLCRDCLREDRASRAQHGRDSESGRSGRSGRSSRSSQSNMAYRPTSESSESSGSGEGSQSIVCGHCGKSDTVPSRPFEKGLTLCRECMENPNVVRVGGRVMHTIICSCCGRENEVPFCPDPGSRVLCRSCHLAERQSKQRARENFTKHQGSAQIPKVKVEILCDRCGCEDSLPFVPKAHGQILCRQCAENAFGEGWAKRNRVGAREYPFTCARCSEKDFVPFKPHPDMLCRHCLNNHALLRKDRGVIVRHDAFTCVRPVNPGSVEQSSSGDHGDDGTVPKEFFD